MYEKNKEEFNYEEMGMMMEQFL